MRLWLQRLMVIGLWAILPLAAPAVTTIQIPSGVTGTAKDYYNNTLPWGLAGVSGTGNLCLSYCSASTLFRPA
jgi:hypothetical protein